MFRFWRGQWYVTAWPKKRGPAKSVHQQRAQDELGFAGFATGRMPPEQYAAAKGMITGTLYVPRDMMIRAIFGLVSQITLEDGTVIEGVRVNVPEANLTLDQITVTPWSLLVRIEGEFAWRGLNVGTPGQVLGVKPDGTPDYIDPSGAVESVFGRTGHVTAAIGDYSGVQVSYDNAHTGLPATDIQGAIDDLYDQVGTAFGDLTPYLQAALDEWSSDPGAIIYRGAAGWTALSPGDPGQVLTSQGSAPELAWATLGGGGGSQWFLPPAAADFPTHRNSVVLTDLPTSGLGITGAAGGTQIRGAYQALGGDKVYTARVWFTGLASNTSAGIAVRDSSGGRCISFGLDFESGVTRVQCTQWNSDTSAASNAWSAPFSASPYAFIRLTWHSVAKTFDLDVGFDGVHWVRMQTANAYVTNPDQIGPYMWSTTTGDFGSGSAAGLVDYWTAV